ELITPLIIASYNGFVSICRLLITVGQADVNQQDNTQKSALLLASYAGHVDVMSELIGHGATLNTLDQYGWSSLMLAAYAGKFDACKLLLAHGADPHIKTANGKNARTLSWDAGHKAIAVYISKFLSRIPNASSSSSGLGGSRSTGIQQILPVAPRSPSRRTHSPAPSLPSVPEEGYEETNYATHRSSFSGQNSTISRQSVLSSRINSRRPHPILIPPSPRASEEEPVSPIPTAIASSHLVTMFNTPNDSSFAEFNLDESSSIADSSAHQSSLPAILPPVQPTTGAIAVEKPERWEHQSRPKTPTQVHTVYRRGIIPRYGYRCLDYTLEKLPSIQPEMTAVTSTSTTIETDPHSRIQLQRPPSKSRSERIKEKEMEDSLNRRLLRKHRSAERSRDHPSSVFSRVLAPCCPARVRSRMWGKDRRRGWRKKAVFSAAITAASLLLGFLTLGLPLLTCHPHSMKSVSLSDFTALYGNSTQATDPGRFMAIRGSVYDIAQLFASGNHPNPSSSNAAGSSDSNVTAASLNTFLTTHYGLDVSYLFSPADLVHTCQLFGAATNFGKCSPAGGDSINHCHQSQASRDMLRTLIRTDIRIVYQWSDLQTLNALGRNLFVFDGAVFDATDYLTQVINGSMITSAERTRMDWIQSLVGKDATLSIQRRRDRRELANCFRGFLQVGVLSGQSHGCIASMVINTLTLATIVLITTLRLTLAILYKVHFMEPSSPETGKTASDNASTVGVSAKGESHVLMLVTCKASDTEDRIRATLDALALTDYEDSKKLLLVFADSSTADTGELGPAALACLRFLDTSTAADSGCEKDAGQMQQEQDIELRLFGGVQIPVEQLRDRSSVHPGHYVIGTRRVPLVVVLRPFSSIHGVLHQHSESWQPKKVVIQWLHRICFNAPMSVFEFKVSERTRELMGQGPELFDMLFMTEVGSVCDRQSVRRCVDALESNARVMGVTGQGVVENRWHNWLTRKQAYEDHLASQFMIPLQSTLGTVQCLPSQFSMVRIKARREAREETEPEVGHVEHRSGDTSVMSEADALEDLDDEVRSKAKLGTVTKGDLQDEGEGVDKSIFSVPILIHPDIVASFIDHLACASHERSQVLGRGGVDRYLASLLHRTFPDRSVVHIPKATFHFVAVGGDDEDGLWIHVRHQSQLWLSDIHVLWGDMWSTHRRGIFCCSSNFLALLEWSHLIFLPLIAILALVLIPIVAVGAMTDKGTLYSLPNVLALAFVLSTTMLQPVMGLLLKSPNRNFADSLVGLCMYIAMLPIKYLVVPVYACWHLDDLDSAATHKGGITAVDEEAPAPIPALGPGHNASTFEQPATNQPDVEERLRYWVEWRAIQNRRQLSHDLRRMQEQHAGDQR
ncbi:hypothetical protein BGZ98_003234, partial [Dissophora globulifera]